MSRLKVEVNQRHAVPVLTGITGEPLRLLGAVRLNIAVGYEECSPWIPVVPDSYLETDMLLGLDVLNKASFKWDAKGQTVVWGDTTYPVRSIPQSKIKLGSNKKIKSQVEEPKSSKIA